MKEQALALGSLIVLAVLIAFCCAHTPQARQAFHGGAGSASARDTLRRLWSDHVHRTHHFIISSLGSLPDAAAVGAHLHENQDQLAAAVGHGLRQPHVAAPLAKLLHEHIDIAGRLVAAHKAGQPAAALAAAWYRNADEIAAFLSRVNPRWPHPATRAMMRSHLDTTVALLRARLAGHWAQAVRLHDRVADQAQHMADTLASGLP